MKNFSSKYLKPIAKKISLVLLGFLLVFGGLNLLAFIIIQSYLKNESKFKDWNERSINVILGTLNWDHELQYHPFWGYHEVRDSELSKKMPDAQFTIRFIGGSFAEDMGRFAIANPELLKKFVRKIRPEINLEKIAIENGAFDGFRQPQQLHLTVDQISNTDLFISYEGYNELIHDRNPCAPSTWPIYAQFRFDPSYKKFHSSLASAYKSLYSFLYRWRNFSLIDLSLFFGGHRIRNYFFDAQKKAQVDAESQCVELIEDASDVQLIADWQRSLELQAAFVESQKKKIFVFIQPNQFIKNSKNYFTPQEQDMFLVTNNEIRSNIDRRFTLAKPILEASVLYDRSLVDMTQIFLNIDQTIYRDGCCHINEEGQRLVLENTISEIEKRWPPRNIEKKK